MTEQTMKPEPTPEQEQRIHANIARADVLVGAIEAVNVAVKAEEDPVYREYLNTTVREFLEEEHRQAEDAHSAYLGELNIAPGAAASERGEA